MGSPPSALGLLGPATAGWLRRTARSARWAVASRRWFEPLRGAAAVALAALDAAWAASLRPSLAGPLAIVGGFAVLAVAAGVLVRRPAPVAAGTALLGAEYLASQAGRPVSVVVAAAFGAVLLAFNELAWWSAELSARTSWGRSELRGRWVALSALAGGGFALGVVVGLVGVARLGPAPVIAVAGAACALLVALAVVSWVRDVSGP